MDKKYIIDCLQKQKEIFETKGHKIAYICVYGSQNYNLDIYNEEYQSDLDMKAILVPTLDNLIKNSKPISITEKTEWGECDLKDIRIYMETTLKANPAYIETLYTDYYLIDNMFINEINTILNMRDELLEVLKPQFLRAIYGMMCEKEKALYHPYPSIVAKIEKFGYDPKQLHHIVRLYNMMNDYFYRKQTLKDCFKPIKETFNQLLEIKVGKYSLDVAKEKCKYYMDCGKIDKDKYLEEINNETRDYEIKDRFLEQSQKIIKDKIVNEILGGV